MIAAEVQESMVDVVVDEEVTMVGVVEVAEAVTMVGVVVGVGVTAVGVAVVEEVTLRLVEVAVEETLVAEVAGVAVAETLVVVGVEGAVVGAAGVPACHLPPALSYPQPMSLQLSQLV